MTPAICISALALRAVPDRRHLARRRRALVDEARPARLGLPGGADRLPDRRLADGGRVGRALARRGVRDRPERRRHPRARRRRETASTTIVFIGRHDARKGLPVLLRAWPEIRRATGARLRLIGTDPLQYRLLHARMGFDDDGIDVLGIVTNEVRSAELASAKAVRLARARRRELRARARGVVRDRDARRRLRHPRLRRRRERRRRRCSSRPATRPRSPTRSSTLLADEERRVAMGRAGRELAAGGYALGRRRAAARGAVREGRRLMRAQRWQRADPGVPARRSRSR